MNDDESAIDELFAAARDLRAPPDAKAQGWARFEAALGGSGPANSGEAALAKPSSLALAAKLGGVLAVVLAVAVPMSEREGPGPEERAARTSARAGAPSVAPRPAVSVATPVSEPPPATMPPPSAPPRARGKSQPSSVPRSTAELDPSAAAEPAAAPEAAALQQPATLQRPTPVPSPQTTDSLRLEAKLLGRAWVAIREGRAEQTQALLDEHARRFPDGALVPERHACQLVGRCIAGDREAIEAARSYLRQHRASHLAARVAAGCGLELSGEAAKSRDETTTPAADASR